MSVKNLSAIYLLKAKRSRKSETLSESLTKIELVRSGWPAAESNTINEKRTKALAKRVVQISFIKPSPSFRLYRQTL
jgi:hypothetical protein